MATAKVKKKTPKKRKTASKRAPQKAKKKTKKSLPKKKSSSKSKQAQALPPPPVEGTLLGRIDDFFAHINVIALTLKSDLRVGNAIHIKGYTTDIIETVTSMQIDHEAVETAKKGDSVGIKISGIARKRDWIFRVE